MASHGESVAMEDVKVAVVSATTNGAVAKESAMNARIGSKPTLISRGGMKFLIMDAPRTANLYLYLKEMKKHNVTSCVRVCEPTYESGDLENAGIKLHDMAYDDGTSPPQVRMDGERSERRKGL